MKNTQITRRTCLFSAVYGVSLALTGCSSGSETSNTNRSPNNTSRQNILKLVGGQQVAMAQNGTQNTAGAAGAMGGLGGMLFFPRGIGGGGGAAGGGAGIPGGAPGMGTGLVGAGVLGRSAKVKSQRLPFIGAFVMNVAQRRPGKASLNAKKAVRTREEVGFYFDEYLGLWVSVTNNDNNYAYNLFEDEAKTKPAGGFTSSYPTDPTVFPQVYRSEYRITAGTLAGSEGIYVTTIQEDGSGTSSYHNKLVGVYSDSGSSTWNVDGSSSWTARSEGKDGIVFEYGGQFNADGSGRTYSTSSNGYSNEFIYNADGTGRGILRGPDAGLPATIVWDLLGNLTITWADGTVEVITPIFGIDVPVEGGGGTDGATDGGTSSGSGGGGSTPPPTP